MQYVDPSRENFLRFKALDRTTPMHLLNLIRYRERADYPAGHPDARNGLSGEQAFAEYVRRVVPAIQALGGGLVWNGTYECMVTGPEAPEWDKVFIMGFPGANAFLALVTDPAYKAEILPHRTAAVLDSRLIRYRP